MALNQIIGTNIDDELLGLFDDDEIFGFDGNDTLDGFVGDDFLYGGFGRDALFGGADNDELYGDDGNDWLDGGDGIDIMWGGLGNDTYVVDNAGDVVIELDYWYFAPPGLTVHEWSASGIDTVKSSISFTLPNVGFHGEIENLTLTGSADIDGSGNALGNVIRGNSVIANCGCKWRLARRCEPSRDTRPTRHCRSSCELAHCWTKRYH
jgi:Ca2+-binding RTX toxin-like protein